MIKILIVDIPDDINENNINISCDENNLCYRLKDLPKYKIEPFTNSTYVKGICDGYNECIRDILNN